MTNNEIREVLEAVVRKLPDRLRLDLTSNDPTVRQSAEETVVMKIAVALGEAMQVSLTAQQNPELPVTFVAESLASMSEPREGTVPFAPRSGARDD